jgi:hypothetical protein
MSPVSGSGGQAIFRVSASDPDGPEDVDNVYLLLNSSFSGQAACFVYYSRSSGRFVLLNDAYTGASGSTEPGSAVSVSNNQCTLNGLQSSVSITGETLSVSFALSFKPSFGGARNLYAMADDAGGAASNWVTGGSWSVQNRPPTIVSLSPLAGSGANANLTVKVKDPDGGADVSQIYVLVSSAFSGQNACFTYYHKPTNAVWLLNDAGTAAAGLVPLASGGIVSNTQCSVLGSSNITYPSSDTVGLDLHLALKSSFSGPGIIYIMAEDSSGATTGWVNAGQWAP